MSMTDGKKDSLFAEDQSDSGFVWSSLQDDSTFSD